MQLPLRCIKLNHKIPVMLKTLNPTSNACSLFVSYWIIVQLDYTHNLREG